MTTSLEELKRLASKKISIGRDEGLNEAERFINKFLIKSGDTPVLFCFLYYKYVQWRISENKKYLSRSKFGKELKFYLKASLTRKGKTNYRTYKLADKIEISEEDKYAAWRLVWDEQKSQKKKVRRS